MPLHRRPHLGPRALLASVLPLLLLAWPAPAQAAGALAAGDFRNVLIPAGGGEPSIALNDNYGTPGLGDIYVVSPGGAGTPDCPQEFHSYDGGRTFSAGVQFDTTDTAPCGDSDVSVAPNGNVIVADLDLSHTWVQVSSDRGQTFNSGTPTAPEDDRPWLTTASNNVVYVAYHDFVAEVPVVCTSLDGGNSFPMCFQAFGPHQSVPQCAENTVPSRALSVDPTDGSLNFMYACSTAQENAQDPPYGPLHDFYLAHSAGQANGVAPVYTTSTVFQADTSGGKAPNYSNIFSNFRIDAAGNYYALFTGTADDNNVLGNPYHVYVVTSTDHGQTWSGLKQVDIPKTASDPGTNVFADMTVTSPGNVDIAWYHSDWTGEPNGACGGTVPNLIGTAAPCTPQQNPFPPASAANAPGWNVEMAQTTDALAAHPLFSQAIVNRQFTHYGEICTNGIVCGSSDRSLADFLSIGVDCTGHAAIAYPANDKSEKVTNIEVASQIAGPAIAPPASCLPAASVAESRLTPMLAAAGAAVVTVVALGRRRRRGEVA